MITDVRWHGRKIDAIPDDRVFLIGHVSNPPDPGIWKRVSIWEIGFDVEDGCSIEQVDSADAERAALHLKELAIGQCNGIGSMRGTGCKDSSLHAVSRREHLGFPTANLIKNGDHPDAIDPDEVFDGLFIVLTSIEFNDRLMLTVINKGLSWSVVFGSIRRANLTDGLERMFHQAVPTESVKITPPKFSIGRPRTLSRPPSPKGMV